MNAPQLIEEVKSGGFQQYDQAGLIDEQSLNRWIRIELSRFGSNIMQGNETTRKVENGKLKLPENFWKLDLALSVDLLGIKGTGDKEDFLQSRVFYRERREVDVEWTDVFDNGVYIPIYKNHKCVTEDIYMPNYQIRSYYGNGRLLRLTKGFKKDKVSEKCHNLSQAYTNSSPHEISIMGDYMNTNFSDGYIYMQYSGLATDEDGEFIIPECNHNRISEYLFNYCRMRILKELIVGDDDPNKISMLQMYTQDTKDSFTLALRDAEWHGAEGWKNAMKKSRVRQTRIYEALLPRK